MQTARNLIFNKIIKLKVKAHFVAILNTIETKKINITINCIANKLEIA